MKNVKSMTMHPIKSGMLIVLNIVFILSFTSYSHAMDIDQTDLNAKKRSTIQEAPTSVLVLSKEQIKLSEWVSHELSAQNTALLPYCNFSVVGAFNDNSFDAESSDSSFSDSVEDDQENERASIAENNHIFEQNRLKIIVNDLMRRLLSDGSEAIGQLKEDVQRIHTINQQVYNICKAPDIDSNSSSAIQEPPMKKQRHN